MTTTADLRALEARINAELGEVYAGTRWASDARNMDYLIDGMSGANYVAISWNRVTHRWKCLMDGIADDGEWWQSTGEGDRPEEAVARAFLHTAPVTEDGDRMNRLREFSKP